MRSLCAAQNEHQSSFLLQILRRKAADRQCVQSGSVPPPTPYRVAAQLFLGGGKWISSAPQFCPSNLGELYPSDMRNLRKASDIAGRSAVRLASTPARGWGFRRDLYPNGGWRGGPTAGSRAWARWSNVLYIGVQWRSASQSVYTIRYSKRPLTHGGLDSRQFTIKGGALRSQTLRQSGDAARFVFSGESAGASGSSVGTIGPCMVGPRPGCV
jgi:hypothetical protein